MGKQEKKRKTTRKHWEEQRQNTGRIKTKIFIRFKSENGTNKEENKREKQEKEKNEKQLENIGENKGKIKKDENKNICRFKSENGNNKEENKREKQEKEKKTKNN